ncbi:hypothetical protein ACFL59_12660, partial [Planctomycetota bacterium]
MASTVALTPDQVAQAKAEALAAMGASGPPNVPGPRSPVPQPLPGPSARPPESAFDPGAATMATPRPQVPGPAGPPVPAGRAGAPSAMPSTVALGPEQIDQAREQALALARGGASGTAPGAAGNQQARGGKRGIWSRVKRMFGGRG